MTKEKKAKGKNADERKELYALKRELDVILVKHPKVRKEVLHLIIQARDVTWEIILSEEENGMPFFRKEEQATETIG